MKGSLWGLRFQKVVIFKTLVAPIINTERMGKVATEAGGTENSKECVSFYACRLKYTVGLEMFFN